MTEAKELKELTYDGRPKEGFHDDLEGGDDEDFSREPRMFTIHQLKELFYLNLNSSEVRTRLSLADTNFSNC